MVRSKSSFQNSIQRYRLIDFSRSLAALAVLALHYDRFVVQADWGEARPGGYIPPLESLLNPIYSHGEYAVPFFWMISGFIFSFVYQGQAVSFRTFSVRRFARLYPLHFVTLLLVALLQMMLFLQISTTLFIPNNDPYHFLLNIFFASAWGFEKGLSFNGPIWSVSVEIIIYVCFWLFISRVPLRLAGSLVMAFAFALMARHDVLPLIALCGTMFFFGASIFFASRRLTSRCFLLCSLVVVVSSVLLLVFVPPVAASKTLSLALIFGPVITLLAAFDQIIEDRYKAVDMAAAFGDLSFSIYLLHFPLILLLVNGCILLGLDRSIFSENIITLVIFVLVTLGLSHLSTTRFEHPARRYFQRALQERERVPRNKPAPGRTAGPTL